MFTKFSSTINKNAVMKNGSLLRPRINAQISWQTPLNQTPSLYLGIIFKFIGSPK